MTVYETLAKEILNYVGGKDNVNSLTHCITQCVSEFTLSLPPT